jgi:hypothetical protein
MSGPLGHQDESQPVTDADKIMSKRHKAHRKEIDKMKDGAAKLEKSLIYNQKHMLEHKKAFKESQKRLKKMGR